MAEKNGQYKGSQSLSRRNEMIASYEDSGMSHSYETRSSL